MFIKKTEDKLEKYIDPTGEFTNSQFKLSRWYVEHKLRLRQIGLGALILFCVVTVGYSLFYWGYYFTTGYWRDQEMLNSQVLEIENYDNLKSFYAPRPFIISSPQVYQTVSPSSYDFVVDLTNNNERWLAGIQYQFVFSGGETPLAQAIVLPGTRPLVYLGFTSDYFPSGARLVIKNIKWYHLDRHIYPDISGYTAERNLWLVENFEFSPISRISGSPANFIEFDLTNNSAYGFWEANFYVELLDQGSRVGILYLPEAEFTSRETRHVDLRSYIDGLYVTEIRVHPLINIFDSREYLRAGER